MRITGLLLLAASCCFAAEDEASNVAIPSLGNDAQVVVRFPSGWQNRWFVMRPRSPDNSVCLKLRTYVVKRITPDSDTTQLHGYSTCQPAWKFETRRAVVHEASPTDRTSRY